MGSSHLCGEWPIESPHWQRNAIGVSRFLHSRQICDADEPVSQSHIFPPARAPPAPPSAEPACRDSPGLPRPSQRLGQRVTPSARVERRIIWRLAGGSRRAPPVPPARRGARLGLRLRATARVATPSAKPRRLRHTLFDNNLFVLSLFGEETHLPPSERRVLAILRADSHSRQVETQPATSRPREYRIPRPSLAKEVVNRGGRGVLEHMPRDHEGSPYRAESTLSSAQVFAESRRLLSIASKSTHYSIPVPL